MIIHHVIPIDDLQEHSEQVNMILGYIPVSRCSCMAQPMLDPDTGGWIIKHAAFDGREALEEVNDILGLSNR